MIKKKYITPTASVVSIKTGGIMQHASVDLPVYVDTETGVEDVQFSRRKRDAWDEEEEEENW